VPTLQRGGGNLGCARKNCRKPLERRGNASCQGLGALSEKQKKGGEVLVGMSFSFWGGGYVLPLEGEDRQVINRRSGQGKSSLCFGNLAAEGWVRCEQGLTLKEEGASSCLGSGGFPCHIKEKNKPKEKERQAKKGKSQESVIKRCLGSGERTGKGV